MKPKASNKLTPTSVMVPPPNLTVRRIGLVSRDYNQDLGNGYKDFSATVAHMLPFLDNAGCDLVLFSLYSFIPRKGFDVLAGLELHTVRCLCFEEFVFDRKGNRKAGTYVVMVRTDDGWRQHRVQQAFGTLAGQPELVIHRFVQQEFAQRRILGNCCLIICGESNAVKYSPMQKRVVDAFGLRQAIPREVSVILNPVHDRMTRFEMLYKRRFLSEGNRWVISVWNKGKINSLGVTRDGTQPAWTVFHNGESVIAPSIANPWGVEIGIVSISE